MDRPSLTVVAILVLAASACGPDVGGVLSGELDLSPAGSAQELEECDSLGQRCWRVDAGPEATISALADELRQLDVVVDEVDCSERGDSCLLRGTHGRDRVSSVVFADSPDAVNSGPSLLYLDWE